MSDPRINTQQMPEAFPLRHPIDVAAGRLSEVRLRRPKLKDVRAMQAAAFREEHPSSQDLAGIAALISSVTGLAPEEVDELDPEDFMPLGEQITAFLQTVAGSGDAGKSGGRSPRKSPTS
jgi:hypothetical protein